MNTKKVTLFLLLTFTLTWGIAFGHQAWLGGIDSPTFLPMLLVMMWMPAVSAIIVQRVIYGEPLADIGLRLRFNRTLIIAWLLPVPFVLLTLLFGALMPGVTFDTGAGVLIAQLQTAGAPAEQIAQVQTIADGLGGAFSAIAIMGLLIPSLLAGATVNALAALGEELGWRGLMQRELEPLGFWRMNLVIGIVWGLWHAPVIWQGYNYPQNPQWGVLMMTAFAVLLSPLHGWVRQRSDTIIAPSILHGTVNASGALTVLFLSGGSDLTIGVTGAAGLLALVLLNIGLWLHLQHTMGSADILSAQGGQDARAPRLTS